VIFSGDLCALYWSICNFISSDCVEGIYNSDILSSSASVLPLVESGNDEVRSLRRSCVPISDLEKVGGRPTLFLALDDSVD
jgi:hypothetical protein